MVDEKEKDDGWMELREAIIKVIAYGCEDACPIEYGNSECKGCLGERLRQEIERMDTGGS